MKKKLVLVVLILSNVVFAQTKVEKIKNLLDLMGSEKNVEVMKTQFVSILKQATPDAPANLLDSLFNRMDIAGLYQITIPIYDKNLSEETINELIKFYKTKAGQDYIKKMPVIMQESMQAGAIWGQKIMMNVINELKSRGYQVNKI
jgi:hypothetical protein